MAKPRRTTMPFQPERAAPDAAHGTSMSGTRPRVSQPSITREEDEGAPLSVDEVGDAAVRLAARVYDRSVPTLVVPRSTLLAVALSPMEVFLASRCDGARTVGALALVSGLPQEEVLHTLRALEARGIVRF